MGTAALEAYAAQARGDLDPWLRYHVPLLRSDSAASRLCINGGCGFIEALGHEGIAVVLGRAQNACGYDRSAAGSVG